MGFLDNYEDVASRIKRFWAAYPSGRIETHIIDFNAVAGYVLIECRLFREYEDEKPSAIDFGFGRVESYQASMKRWFVEDTVTSAIGRAIGLLLGSDTRPTQENMKQVENMPVAFVNKIEDDPWSKPAENPTSPPKPETKKLSDMDDIFGSSPSTKTEEESKPAATKVDEDDDLFAE